MMKKFRRFNCILLGLFGLFIVSCASKPRFSGSGDLCGYVVDENNEPVEEFIISCRGQGGLWNTSITNKNGFFVFENIALGDCWFKGRKNAYVELDKNLQIFGDRGKVICFQVLSIDRALDKVEEMFLYGDLEGAEYLLEKIISDEGSPAQEVLNIYKQYLNVKKSAAEIEGEKRNEEENV